MADTIAIIQGGPSGHPDAPAWYRANPSEPIGNGQTINVENIFIHQDISLDSILDTILAEKPKNVLTVCHGSATGLALPLLSGSKYAFDDSNAIALASDRTFEFDGIKTPVFTDDRAVAGVSEAQVAALRAKMNRARALGLNHIAFRACDLGANTAGPLVSYHRFFLPKSVSAPKFGDVYGHVKTELNPKLADWITVHRKKPYAQVWEDNNVAFSYTKLSPRKFLLQMRSANQAEFTKWCQAHVSPSSGKGTSVTFHAMETRTGTRGEAGLAFVLDTFFKTNITVYPRP